MIQLLTIFISIYMVCVQQVPINKICNTKNENNEITAIFLKGYHIISPWEIFICHDKSLNTY